MTFLQIQQDVYRRLDYADVPAAAVSTRIKSFINQRYHRLLSRPGISRLRDKNTTFNTIAATSTYQLAADVMRIKALYLGAQGIKLEPRDLAWLRRQDAGLTVSGVPEFWIPLGDRETANTAFRWTVQLWPVPDTIYTLGLDYVAALTEMAADADVPSIPDDFHYLLAVGARCDEYERMEDPRLGAVRGEWEDGVRKLIAFVVGSDDLIVIPGNSDRGFSNLGPFFPSGSWE